MSIYLEPFVACSDNLSSLSDNARAREALRQCLPEPLRDATFSPVLRDDAATKRCLAQLLLALSDQAEPAGMTGTYGQHAQGLMA